MKFIVSLLTSVGIGTLLTGKDLAHGQTVVADGVEDWVALLESGIAFPGAGFGSISFPDQGSQTYVFRFENEWQTSTTMPGWQGAVAVSMNNNAQPAAEAFQVSGSRLTEGNDFNVGGMTHDSGSFYEVMGRGSTVFNNGSSSSASTWEIDYDFSGLANGYLPAGTLISIVDTGDGPNETMIFEAGLEGGATAAWMELIDFTINQGGQDQQTPAYRGANIYDVGLPPEGPSLATGSAEYVLMRTTRDITDLSFIATQGPSGGSTSLKFLAPTFIPEPSSTILVATAIGSFCFRRKRL